MRSSPLVGDELDVELAVGACVCCVDPIRKRPNLKSSMAMVMLLQSGLRSHGSMTTSHAGRLNS